MPTIYVAHTVPVNPPGATPVLTEATLFAGFRHKVRHPEAFVPAIAQAEVLSDADGVVRRRVVFKPESAPAGSPAEAVEVCTEHAPHRVDFAMDNGSTVLNIIGQGSSGGPDDLYVTYAFAWAHPELAPGTAAYAEAEALHKKVAKVSVESSLATTRKLVLEGKLAA